MDADRVRYLLGYFAVREALQRKGYVFSDDGDWVENDPENGHRGNIDNLPPAALHILANFKTDGEHTRIPRPEVISRGYQQDDGADQRFCALEDFDHGLDLVARYTYGDIQHAQSTDQPQSIPQEYQQSDGEILDPGQEEDVVNDAIDEAIDEAIGDDEGDMWGGIDMGFSQVTSSSSANAAPASNPVDQASTTASTPALAPTQAAVSRDSPAPAMASVPPSSSGRPLLPPGFRYAGNWTLGPGWTSDRPVNPPRKQKTTSRDTTASREAHNDWKYCSSCTSWVWDVCFVRGTPPFSGTACNHCARRAAKRRQGANFDAMNWLVEWQPLVVNGKQSDLGYVREEKRSLERNSRASDSQAMG